LNGEQVTDTNRKARCYNITVAGRRQLAAEKAKWDRTTARRGVPWLDDVKRDMNYAVRGLARNPGFTAVAVCL
jgi:DNA-binding PadR family transcriptional regulator